MSNYDLDEIERKRSQKQKQQLEEYKEEVMTKKVETEEVEVSNSSTAKPENNLPEYPVRKGKRLEDAIIKHVSPDQSHILKGIRQWDAQTQSYVTFSNDQDNIRWLHENEEVTSPKHYVGLGITPLEYITANELDFLEGNIIKYVTRYPHKGGVNDLLKARTYLEKLIEREVEKS